MSKNAYERGVVLMECDSCKSRHLIADNKGWFRDKSVNIEDLMREKGEEVRQLKDMGLLDSIEAGEAQKAMDNYSDIVSKRSRDPKNPLAGADAPTQRHDKGYARPGGYQRSVSADVSPVPTRVVRLSRLAPGTTTTDVRNIVAGDTYAKKIKSLSFEYDSGLQPLQSCRVVFFNQEDATEFVMRFNKAVFSGNTIRANYVVREAVPNKTTEAYLGGMLGRLVFLYGYPPHVSPLQIRDYYRDYDIVDTTLPGIQRAPQQGETFLVRRRAFVVQFSTPSEAQRFVRNVYHTKFIQRDNSADDSQASATNSHHEYVIKAILLH
ncbi:hypothetical protein IWW37_000280 [Coemansia sp. RSA 2050]|nr:hypothetical protein IWW37_000280 [Coemansia sp. RSA 2050]